MRLARLIHPALPALAGAALLLGDCSGPVTDPASPWYVPLPGSQVEVLRPLPVPPGSTRVFLQYGQVVRLQDLERYDANCNFEINTRAERWRDIAPGTFTITRTLQEEGDIVCRLPIRYAALRMFGDGGSPSPMYIAVHMWLQNPDQPDVRRLTCRGGIADPWEMEAPTLADMRAALGDYARIEVKGE